MTDRIPTIRLPFGEDTSQIVTGLCDADQGTLRTGDAENNFANWSGLPAWLAERYKSPNERVGPFGYTVRDLFGFKPTAQERATCPCPPTWTEEDWEVRMRSLVLNDRATQTYLNDIARETARRKDERLERGMGGVATMLVDALVSKKDSRDREEIRAQVLEALRPILEQIDAVEPLRIG